jgi:hypothetical protein
MSALAIEVLAAVRDVGGDVTVEGNRLRVVAPNPLPTEVVERLRAVKPDLLMLLSEPAPDPYRCIMCGRAETPAAAVVPFLRDDRRGHHWLHPECWASWATEQAKKGASAYAQWLANAEPGEGAP